MALRGSICITLRYFTRCRISKSLSISNLIQRNVSLYHLVVVVHYESELDLVPELSDPTSQITSQIHSLVVLHYHALRHDSPFASV